MPLGSTLRDILSSLCIMAQETLWCTKSCCVELVEGVKDCLCQMVSYIHSAWFRFFDTSERTYAQSTKYYTNTNYFHRDLRQPCWNKLDTLRLVLTRHDRTSRVVSCRVKWNVGAMHQNVPSLEFLDAHHHVEMSLRILLDHIANVVRFSRLLSAHSGKTQTTMSHCNADQHTATDYNAFRQSLGLNAVYHGYAK